MTDLSELKAMADANLQFVNDPQSNALAIGRYLRAQSEAVLDYIKSQEPVKEPRKFGQWAVIDEKSRVNFVADGERAIRIAERWNHLSRGGEYHWPCYLTGEEGVGPEGKGFDKIKRGPNNYEPVRQWLVYSFPDGAISTEMPCLCQGLRGFGARQIRVREVIE